MRTIEDKCPLIKEDEETKQEICLISGIACPYKINGNCVDYLRYKERMEEVDLGE